MHKQVLEVQAAGAGARASRHPEQHEQPGCCAVQQRAACRGCSSMHRQVLEVQQRVLGPEHPDTLISMNNLACSA